MALSVSLTTAYMSDSPPGEKSHGISADLTAGDADPPFFKKINFFFVISGTFGSFWDVADHYNYMRFY